MPAALGSTLEEFLAALEGGSDAGVAAEAAELRWGPRLRLCTIPLHFRPGQLAPCAHATALNSPTPTSSSRPFSHHTNPLPFLHPSRCWALYFDYESEFAGWQQLYRVAAEALQAAEAADPAGPAAAAARQQLGALAEQTLPLLGAMLEFLGQRGIDCLVGWGAGGAGAAWAGAPAEVTVVVGPDAGDDTPAEVQQGAAFPSYAGPEEQAGEAEVLLAALAASVAATPEEEQRQLAVAAVGPAREDMPGLISGPWALWGWGTRCLPRWQPPLPSLQLVLRASAMHRLSLLTDPPLATPALQSCSSAAARRRWRQRPTCWRTRSRAACPRQAAVGRQAQPWRRSWCAPSCLSRNAERHAACSVNQ